jgi:peptidoglycan hydrolase-like protein with peptidoglycan-binding domain
VRAAQVELIRLGYYRGAADGVMGPHTYSAIASFEQANGLPVDGSASGRLVAKLQSTPTSNAVAATAPPPAASAGWVAPGTPSGGAPVTATAPASSGWVAPTKTP